MSSQKQYYLCPDSEIARRAVAQVFADLQVKYKTCIVTLENGDQESVWEMPDYATASGTSNVFNRKGFPCVVRYSLNGAPLVLASPPRTISTPARIAMGNILMGRAATRMRGR